MGIPKLTSFIIKKNCWKPFFLGQGSRIVIDGFGLCYRLHYGIESGEYCCFYEKVVSYLLSLKKNGVEVYVVIDGIDYDKKKVKTHRSRNVKCLSRLWEVNSNLERLASPFEITISYMARKVFIDAVRDSTVNYFVADGEADRDIVSLANHLGCPVFGSDSDFFIFNIEGGYIPMNDASGQLIDLNGEVQCFSYRQFDSAHDLSGLYPRLPIAYCVGNDFHDSNPLLELGIEKFASIETVISKCSGVKFDNLQKKFPDDFTFYHVEACAFDQLCHSMFLCEFNPSIPKWVVANFKQGLFSAVSTSFLTSKTWNYTLAIEDLSRDSASKGTDRIFPYVAGALLSCERSRTFIRECRKNSSFDIEEVRILLSDKHASILGSHTLENVPDMSPVERIDIFLRVFHCKSICRKLQGVPGDLKLAVIASRCWLRNIDDIDCQFSAFVVALVFCLKKCIRGSPDVQDLPPNQMGRLRYIHHLAQWEYMFHLAFVFNQILGCPFPYTSLGQLFSKSVFKSFFTSKPEYLLSRLDEEGKIMYEAITKQLLPNGPIRQVTRVVVAHAPIPPSISTQNRYASLPEI